MYCTFAGLLARDEREDRREDRRGFMGLLIFACASSMLPSLSNSGSKSDSVSDNEASIVCYVEFGYCREMEMRCC